MKRPITGRGSVSISYHAVEGGGYEYTLYGYATDDNPKGVAGRDIALKMSDVHIRQLVELLSNHTVPARATDESF